MTTSQISFSDFCKRVFPAQKRCAQNSERRSVGQFVIDMLATCGCHIFNDPRTTPRKLHSGDDGRTFTQNYRNECREINLEKMKAFFLEIVESEDAEEIARQFFVSFSENVNKEALALALSYQLKALIENGKRDDIVGDIVAKEYERIISSPSEPIDKTVVLRPLYPEDACRRMFQQSQTATCYSDYPVILTVMNSGKVEWVNRKLVLKKGFYQNVEISETEFELPPTKPNTMAAVRFNLRFRDEGTYPFTWKITDYNGDDCFPNAPDMLSFNVSVTYIPLEKGGTHGV